MKKGVPAYTVAQVVTILRQTGETKVYRLGSRKWGRISVQFDGELEIGVELTQVAEVRRGSTGQEVTMPVLQVLPSSFIRLFQHVVAFLESHSRCNLCRHPSQAHQHRASSMVWRGKECQPCSDISDRCVFTRRVHTNGQEALYLPDPFCNLKNTLLAHFFNERFLGTVERTLGG